MSTEPTKIPSSPELDALEERLVIENLEVVERVVWGIVRMERRLIALREWYEETRDKRKRKLDYLRRLVESYAVPWRIRTGESVLPIETGVVRVTKGRVVDLSDEEKVTQWVRAANLADLMADPQPESRVPMKITIAPDWKALREWARWTEDGIGCDPRTGEEIPGLRRGRAEPWHVSIKPRDQVTVEAELRLEAEPDVEPIVCDVCGGEGKVRFENGTIGGIDAGGDIVVDCGTCHGSGVLGVRAIEDVEHERGVA